MQTEEFGHGIDLNSGEFANPYAIPKLDGFEYGDPECDDIAHSSDSIIAYFDYAFGPDHPITDYIKDNNLVNKGVVDYTSINGRAVPHFIISDPDESMAFVLFLQSSKVLEGKTVGQDWGSGANLDPLLMAQNHGIDISLGTQVWLDMPIQCRATHPAHNNAILQPGKAGDNWSVTLQMDGNVLINAFPLTKELRIIAPSPGVLTDNLEYWLTFLKVPGQKVFIYLNAIDTFNRQEDIRQLQLLNNRPGFKVICSKFSRQQYEESQSLILANGLKTSILHHLGLFETTYMTKQSSNMACMIERSFPDDHNNERFEMNDANPAIGVGLGGVFMAALLLIGLIKRKISGPFQPA